MKRATLIALVFAVVSLIFVPVNLAKEDMPLGYHAVISDTSLATAYNSLEAQTDSTPWITASGTRCRWGVVAANHLPIGTKIKIEGFGNKIFIVEDRMNKRYHKKIDIWMPTYKEAIKFGVRKIRYHVLKEA